MTHALKCGPPRSKKYEQIIHPCLTLESDTRSRNIQILSAIIAVLQQMLKILLWMSAKTVSWWLRGHAEWRCVNSERIRHKIFISMQSFECKINPRALCDPASYFGGGSISKRRRNCKGLNLSSPCIVRKKDLKSYYSDRIISSKKRVITELVTHS